MLISKNGKTINIIMIQILEKILENNKKYYYQKKYKITKENVLTRIYFN